MKNETFIIHNIKKQCKQVTRRNKTSQLKVNKLGISRALYKLSEYNEQRKLKTNGFLTRNSLCKERRSANCLFVMKRINLIKRRIA